MTGIRDSISYSITKGNRAIVSITFGVLTFGIASGKIFITVTGVVLVSIYAYLAKEKVSKQQLIDLSILTILFWLPCLWLIRSPDFTLGLKEIERFALFFVLPVIVTFIPSSKENLLTIARSACFAVISVYILSLSVAVYNYYYTEHPWGIQSEFFFYTELSNGLFSAHPLYLSVAGFIAGMVSLLVFNDRPLCKWTILVFTGLMIILLNGRILVLLYLSLVFLYLFNIIVSKKSKFYVVIGAAFFVVTVCGVIALSKIHDKPNRSYVIDVHDAIEKSSNPSVTSQNNGLIVRLAIWRNALAVIQENPIWGHGTGSERRKLQQQYYSSGYLGLYSEGLTAHNQLLFFLIEFGITGTLAITIAFGWMLSQAIRKRNWLYVSFIGFS
jgi:O-antigen ligase